ncbi:MAG: D-lactate dehydrogenase [Gammaproteobacteria bacterium]|nr:D-lactate dehydrogenase [Gammaproteobacteria bacterium]
MVASINKKHFLIHLEGIVGRKSLLIDPKKTVNYRKGFRFGGGDALGVVIPNSLVELWKVAQACVDADIIMIIQAANTGLTGGSTPFGEYDRDVLIVSTVRLNDIHVIRGGKQVLAFPGSRLYELEKELQNYGREPHSVIGSSCIGASVIGGVCNNSGGALVQRGPAYTELALYGRIDENQRLVLVNNLGVILGDAPEEMLSNLENQKYIDVENVSKSASDSEYKVRVREIDESSPSRFNNDKRRLYEASGCAGKLIVFAVRLDTFEKAKQEKVFYIGTNEEQVFTDLRRNILSQFDNLPVSGEYMHRDYFDVCDKFGKDSFVAIEKLGSEVMPKLFAAKSKVDRVLGRLPFVSQNMSEHILQFFSKFLPNHLTAGMRDYRERYEHHLILHMSDEGVDEARAFLSGFFGTNEGDFYECGNKEGQKAFLHRFVAGGAAKRLHAMKRGRFGDIMALDIALPRNEREWFEKLPKEIDDLIEVKLYCGHFLCYVMHQDYVLKKGVDSRVVKEKLQAFFDAKGAEYPAEHNVGQQYHAKQDLANFYRQADPTNSLNPGVGRLSKNKNWEG